MNNNDLTQIRKIVKEEVSTSEKRIIGELGGFMEDHLLPIIDAKADKTDIDRIERKLDKFIDTSLHHENRIKAIEHIPVISHQLKTQKN